MAVIDADTHVIETDQTWNYLDPSDQQFRPVVISPRGEGGREYWYIDGKIRGLARQAVTAPDVSALEASSVARWQPRRKRARAKTWTSA